MFARIGTWQGTPEELNEWIERSRTVVKPNIEKDPGLKAVYWLVDRDAGQGIIFTIWESEQAMQLSEVARARRQAAMGGKTGAKVTTARFEVVDTLFV